MQGNRTTIGLSMVMFLDIIHLLKVKPEIRDVTSTRYFTKHILRNGKIHVLMCTISYIDDILLLTILGVLSGAEGWIKIEEFGQAKYHWLTTFLELPNSIPSHDTLGRIFAMLDPEPLQNRVAFSTGYDHWSVWTVS